MLTGCFTAIITPFKGGAVDTEGLDALVDYQIENGISGVLAVGTTGESPVLTWDEHDLVVANIAKKTNGKCICIAGAGSMRLAAQAGAAAATNATARLTITLITIGIS